jgi:hypothetical protein
MQKLHPKRSARRVVSRAKSRSLREISVDDVLKGLLDLFAHLGIDASRLAARVVDLDPVSLASQRLYPHASAIGELLTAWHQEPKYLDESGSPAPIKMSGPGHSFRRLAARTVPDMKFETLFAELQRSGAVTVDASGRARVHMRSLPVYEDSQLAIQHTLASLDSFIKTLRHNLNSTASNSDQLFHRVAWNGDFDSSEIPALKIRMKRHGQSFLESCDNWMSRRAKSATPTSRKKKPVQVFVGIYLAVDEGR